MFSNGELWQVGNMYSADNIMKALLTPKQYEDSFLEDPYNVPVSAKRFKAGLEKFERESDRHLGHRFERKNPR